MENGNLKYLLGEVVMNNDQRSYKELFISYYDRLYSFAFSILKSREDAEEVVSDFFIMVWQKKANLLEIDNLRLYFFITIKNLSINKLSKRKKNSTQFNEEYLVHFKSPFFNPDELLLSREAVAMILEAINELPPKCKMIFKLIKEDGLKYNDVASLLNISIKTVEAQMAIAIKRIGNSYNFRSQFPELHSILSGKKN